MNPLSISKVYPIDYDWGDGYFTIDASRSVLLREAAQLIWDEVRGQLQSKGFTEPKDQLFLDGPHNGTQVGYEFYRMGLSQAPDMVRIGGMIGMSATWEITRGSQVSDALEKIHGLLTQRNTSA